MAGETQPKEVQSLTFNKVGDLTLIPIKPNFDKTPTTLSKALLLTDGKNIVHGYAMRYNQEYQVNGTVTESGTIVFIIEGYGPVMGEFTGWIRLDSIGINISE